MLTAYGVLESDEEDQKVINGICRALRNGGRFLLDMANRDKIIRNYLLKDHRHHEDGTIEIIDRKFDHVSGLHLETIVL
jgi:SAM-dependent methyltransferase